MGISLDGHDIPDEVRELVRLQDQRIRRLEAAVTVLLEESISGEEVGEAGRRLRAALADDRHRRLFRRQVNEAGWAGSDDAWDRETEPDWVWEHLAEDEAEDAWRAQHPLH